MTFLSFSSLSGGMTGTLSTTIMHSVPKTSTGFSARISPNSSEKVKIAHFISFLQQYLPATILTRSNLHSSNKLELNSRDTKNVKV